jgi:hypothetical protein
VSFQLTFDYRLDYDAGQAGIPWSGSLPMKPFSAMCWGGAAF